jgi:hypothetical protein
MLICNDLKWSLKEIIETRLKFISFEEDWDLLEMEIYNEM